MIKKDWQTVGALAALGALVVGVHGITNKRWSDWHTAIVVVAAVSTIAPQL